MKRCECDSEMLAKRNEGNVWECANHNCDHVEPIKYCVKCGRLLHAPVLQDEDDERCICCCDRLGHDETPDGKPIDWDQVPCCPECGSFDVRLRAKVTMEGWTKFNPATGEQTATSSEEFIADSEEVEESGEDGGHCDSCDADWDDGNGCLGGDWGRCRPIYVATIIAAQPCYTKLESRARGPQDAAAIFKEMIKKIQNDELLVDWTNDDGDPYDEELIEITEDETNEVVWTRPGPPEVKGEVFQVLTPTGWIRSYGEGETVRLLQASYDSEGTETIAEFTFSRYALAAIDRVRKKSE
jgi:hypothetical protein